MLVCWALRRRSALLQLPVLVLNAVMIASTLCLGLHYGADVLGGAALAAVSIVAYRHITITAGVRSSARAPMHVASGDPPPVTLGEFDAALNGAAEKISMV